MSRRAPAARGKADANQKPIAAAIRMLGYPVMELNTAGNGVEDLLVGIDMAVRASTPFPLPPMRMRSWLLVECKVIETESTGYFRYTKAQKEWRAKTEGWPRITVTSAQDAVDQIRRMTG